MRHSMSDQHALEENKKLREAFRLAQQRLEEMQQQVAGLEGRAGGLEAQVQQGAAREAELRRQLEEASQVLDQTVVEC